MKKNRLISKITLKYSFLSTVFPIVHKKKNGWIHPTTISSSIFFY